MVIQLRAAPAVPVAQPVASPVAPQPAPPAYAPLPDGAPIVRARKAPKGRDWLTYSLLIGGFLVLVGLGVGAAVIQMGGGPGRGGGNEPMTNADLNVSFEPPGGAWQRNNNLRDKMPV